MSSTTKTVTNTPDQGKPGDKIPKVRSPKTEKPKPKDQTTTKSRATAKGVSAKERRLALVRLLRKLKATSGGTARPFKELAEKLGYTEYDVYCLGYHKFLLAAQGFIKTAPVEGAGNGYYLTAKGQKTDPA